MAVTSQISTCFYHPEWPSLPPGVLAAHAWSCWGLAPTLLMWAWPQPRVLLHTLLIVHTPRLAAPSTPALLLHGQSDCMQGCGKDQAALGLLP